MHNYSLMFWQCPRISLIQGTSLFYMQNISFLQNISLLQNICQVQNISLLQNTPPFSIDENFFCSMYFLCAFCWLTKSVISLFKETFIIVALSQVFNLFKLMHAIAKYLLIRFINNSLLKEGIGWITWNKISAKTGLCLFLLWNEQEWADWYHILIKAELNLSFCQFSCMACMNYNFANPDGLSLQLWKLASCTSQSCGLAIAIDIILAQGLYLNSCK